MSAIATYRTAVLALLDDVSKTRYTDAQVDQGIRLALMEYTRAKPVIASYIVSCDGTEDLEMPADFSAAFITNVELWNATPDLIEAIPFYAYKRDFQWIIHTVGIAYSASYVLVVTYSSSHYIDGLDSGAGTSIPDEDEQVLEIGAAGFAALSRSSSRAETINMQPAVSAQVAKVADNYLAQFRAAIGSRSGAWFADPPMMQDIEY